MRECLNSSGRGEANRVRYCSAYSSHLSLDPLGYVTGSWLCVICDNPRASLALRFSRQSSFDT